MRFRKSYFGAAYGFVEGAGGAVGHPLPKICLTFPTKKKLGAVISYPKQIQKLYKSLDTPLEFCWHHHFFTENQQSLLYQEIQI